MNTRLGERPTLLVGLALITVGLALLGRAPIDSTFVVDLLPAMLLIGEVNDAAMPADRGGRLGVEARRRWGGADASLTA